MVAHLYGTTIHRALLARGVKEVDELASAWRYAAYITCITFQRQRLVLHAVVGEIYSAFVIIQYKIGT